MGCAGASCSVESFAPPASGDGCLASGTASMSHPQAATQVRLVGASQASAGRLSEEDYNVGGIYGSGPAGFFLEGRGFFFDIPNEHVGFFIGARGSGIKRLESEFGVRLVSDKEPLQPATAAGLMPLRRVWVQGGPLLCKRALDELRSLSMLWLKRGNEKGQAAQDAERERRQQAEHEAESRSKADLEREAQRHRMLSYSR